MGKPFRKELDSLESTYNFVNSLNIDLFKKAIKKTLARPLYIIGSGGSLSACHFAEMLHQQYGLLGKAITPLESHYLKQSFSQANILIITAGGKNKDILFAFDQAIATEPDSIISLCTSAQSLLAKKASHFSISSAFEYPLPTGKDGFLASNSLLAFFTLLARGYDQIIDEKFIQKADIIRYEREIEIFLDQIDVKAATFQVLYGGWSKPVAIDLESKFTEAALANSLLSDFRNFGHGRHHWFDKKRKNSSIIALVSPQEKELAHKTILQLPNDIPVLQITTSKTLAAGTIELLIKSFYLINKIGERQGIDPGRPGVPGFGSKLYQLSYSTFYKKNETFNKSPYIEIQRKIRPENINNLTTPKLKKWLNNYKAFTDSLIQTRFGSIIFDYDRTLCSDTNRLTGPAKDMIKEIINILSNGLIIGIVTGRGLSVKTDLRKCLPKKYWKNIFVGYYNGAEIGSLTNDEIPDRKEGNEPIFIEIKKLLKETSISNEIEITQRTFQLTIECKNSTDWEAIKPVIYQKSMAVRNGGFMILESSRSLDIIKRPEVSKLNIIDYIKSELRSRNLAEQCLCIGDKGKWPGNDFELLNTPYSLSVNEVSLDPNTCWNLAPLGIRDTEACNLYLKAVKLHKNYFNLSL